MDYNGSTPVIRRKSAAPLGGSNNPFDDFDVMQEQNDLINTFASFLAPQKYPQQYDRSADSDIDVFGLFSDNEGDTRPSSASSPTRSLTYVNATEQDFRGSSSESDSDNAENPTEAEPQGPPIPKRIDIPERWVQRMKEPVIPLHGDDAQLYAFVMCPLEEGCALRMSVSYDTHSKTFSLIQNMTKRVILTASKRTDGLKALALSSNISIMLMPTDRSFAEAARTPAPSFSAGSMVEPVRIAKIRCNALGAQYSLFDSGKSPSKAMGAIDLRRELMSVRFELLSGVYSRRAAWCCIPQPNAVRRPSRKEETLHERSKKCDTSVLALSPMVPYTTQLPRLEDFGSFVHSHSIKNTMLHDPKTKQVIFRLGRNETNTFDVEFCHPFSIVSAFGLVLATIDSKVHPSRQI